MGVGRNGICGIAKQWAGTCPRWLPALAVALLGFSMVACGSAAGPGERAASTAQDSGPKSSEMQTARASGDPADLSMLPEPPQRTPDPWIPFAVEKSMGAVLCPDSPGMNGRLGVHTLHQSCKGLVPRHLAQALLDVPTSAIHLPVDARAIAAREPGYFKALPGYGERPDFMAYIGGDALAFTVRSFEGMEPAATVYAVEGPFRCVDDDPLVRDYEDIDTEGCARAIWTYRLWRRAADGRMEDVTDELLKLPEMTADEKLRYEDASLRADASKLAAVPVFRWRASPSGDDDLPASDSRRYEPFRAHFGFSVWNGTGFERHEHVRRDMWPAGDCSRWTPDPRCESTGGQARDPFVLEESVR